MARISETNPYEDALFAIRTIAAGRGPAHVKMRDIKLVMIEFDGVMETLQSKDIVPLVQFPTGTNDE